MLTDPQSVTINAVANSLPAVRRGDNLSVYQKDDTTVKLTVSHQYQTRTRRMVRLDLTKIAADPITAQNASFSMAAYLVIDQPKSGFTIAEAKQLVDALTAYLTASSGAKVTSVLGGES